jgi:hypothetical protein
MSKDNTAKSFLTGIASNAAWEWIKAVCGGLISAMTSALIQYLHHRPVDWWGLLILGSVTTFVLGLILIRSGARVVAVASDSQAPSFPVPPALDPYAGILTPLQLDALKLAGNLLTFLPTLEPQPSDMTTVEWRRIVRAKYALQFQAEAVSVCQRLAAVGVSDHHFASLVDSTDSPENLADLARTLRRMAFAVFGD